MIPFLFELELKFNKRGEVCLALINKVRCLRKEDDKEEEEHSFRTARTDDPSMVCACPFKPSVSAAAKPRVYVVWVLMKEKEKGSGRRTRQVGPVVGVFLLSGNGWSKSQGSSSLGARPNFCCFHHGL